MVASEESDAIGVLELQAEQELEGLDRVVPAIDKIAHENVSSVRDLTSFLKKFEQVMELAMDVAANCHWGAHRLHIAFLDQDLLYLFTQDAQVSLWENSTILYSKAMSLRLFLTFQLFLFSV